MTGSRQNSSVGVLEQLRPLGKPRLMDLIEAAGLDISDWANFAGGVALAATNPRYCYEWSFVDPTRLVVLNLWHANMVERNGVISIPITSRRDAEHFRREGVRPEWARRGENLDRAVQEAVRYGLPVRVVINDGRMRTARDPLSSKSKVERRALDPVPWSVSAYDPLTGDATLVRGPRPDQLADQFTAIEEPEAEVLRREEQSARFVRSQILREKALARANGRCEYCGVMGFATPGGEVFLETHHIVPLSEKGPDSLVNLAAICPNHHREAHLGSGASLIRAALQRLRRK